MQHSVHGAPPRLTAILSCRNAEPTLDRLLCHLSKSGADVIVIDNRSTDNTRAIAEEHRQTCVVEICDDPFTGVFDLTHQLRRKRDIIRSVGSGWILHADADEFVDTPDGSPLSEYLALWNDSDVVAFPCTEFLFLPETEGVVHRPDEFETSMQSYVHFRERDPKQRVFRAQASLDLWMKTGGHTVARPADQIAPEALPLRHYFGLSLDQIRSEYLARVFADRDLAKLWHNSRAASEHFDIVAPPAGSLQDASQGLRTDCPVRDVPVFATRTQERRNDRAAATLCDLTVIGLSDNSTGQVTAMISKFLPGLRVVAGVGSELIGNSPVLHVVQHPARDVLGDHTAHGEAWLRQVASVRQAAVSRCGPYCEVRLEELESGASTLKACLPRLLAGQTRPAISGFLPQDAVPIEIRSFPERVRAIAGALGRDLGYC